MASQQKSSPLLFESMSKPVERWPAWIRVIYWCILGAVTAVLVATLISCPILLLLRFLYPGDFQTILTQSQVISDSTTLTPAPSGSPGSGTASPGNGSASEGTATNSTATAEPLTNVTASPLPPAGSPESGTDSSSSSATGTAASDGSGNSATLDGADSNGSSGSGPESASSPTGEATSEGGSTNSTTPGAGSADGASSQSTSAAENAALTATVALIEPSPTFTPIPPSPTSTPTPIPPSSTPTATPTPTIPTATPTPRGPTPPPRRTPAPRSIITPSNPAPPPTSVPLPTNTPRPTSTPTPTTPTRVAVQPVSTRIVAPTTAPNLPGGILTLIHPISIQIPPSRGPTTFIWEWVGAPLPPEFGFEVRVWLNGEPQAGVHDAVLDHQERRIEFLGSDRYQLKVGNIRYAKGVLGREGIYNWTVAVVRVSPAYADLGLQAVPARFRYEPFPVGR